MRTSVSSILTLYCLKYGFITEPEAGAAFEVRARATVDGVNAFFGGPEVFYGEYSDTVTVTVP